MKPNRSFRSTGKTYKLKLLNSTHETYENVEIWYQHRGDVSIYGKVGNKWIPPIGLHRRYDISKEFTNILFRILYYTDGQVIRDLIYQDNPLLSLIKPSQDYLSQQYEPIRL